MNWKNIDAFPVMGEWLNQSNAILLDFSVANIALQKETYGNIDLFSIYVDDLLKRAGVPFGYGGYFENRIIYNVFENFATPEEHRNIHLGIDVWGTEGMNVYCPLDGTIHSFKFNEGDGNYGPAIIVKHDVDGETFFSLYGHLQKDDLTGLQVGQTIKKGSLLCHLGGPHENGKWPPHLHFQLIRDLEGWEGDYPGVCAAKDEIHFRNNCPDPISLIYRD
jgi:murein DD-endopeptidase MepM/ murein hydrolase activator NlpD